MVADPEDLLVALRHATRREILRLLLVQSSNRAMSPRELAGLLGQQLSNVSYHVRVLKELGAVELTDTEPVKGSIKHYYRAAPIIEDTAWVRETLGLGPAD